jgi:MFS family permease
MSAASEWRAFAGFALAAGVASVLAVLMSQAPQLPAEELLAYVAAHKAGIASAAVSVLVWMSVSIPFVAGLGVVLAGERKILASAATLLSVGGIFLLGFASFVSIGSSLALAAAAEVVRPGGEVDYQVAVWRNLSFYMSDPGLMAWGFGQFLFALLAWNAAVFPRWLAVVGFIGGIAGLLTLAVYQTAVLALVQIGAFAVWGVAVGVIGLRRKSLTPG